MKPPNLDHLPLERLIVLAAQRDLLESWEIANDSVHLRVGIVDVSLTERRARVYLRGLIRGHDRAHETNGDA